MQDYGPEWGQRLDSLDVAMDAQAHLALTFNERLEMFHACPYPVNGDDGEQLEEDKPTATEAASMLRNYAKTGRVAWPSREASVE